MWLDHIFLIKPPFPYYLGCQPTRIWGFIRHGTRRPSKAIMRRILKLQEIRDQIVNKNYGNLCIDDIEKLRKWSINDYGENEGSFLVNEGFDEMVDLAERMQHRLPNLLLDSYDNSTYKV